MPITPEDLTRREVCYVASSLIHTLANGAGIVPYTDASRDLSDLIEQAADLAAPVDDWESAAIEEGWTIEEIRDGFSDGGKEVEYFAWKGGTALDPDQETGWCDTAAEAAFDACHVDDIEPHYREVYEHWIVTDWLAEKLEQHGEKVDHDFAGLTIWARTTTGQAISLDGVIEAIARELGE